MSEKRIVYAEDVIQRIRDLAPEILGGWYNPDMENELEQLVCVVENTPTAPTPDAQRWRKTAEEPPMEKDGNQYGDVLVLDASLEGLVTNKGWLYVKRAPDIYPIWMPIPKPPRSYLEDEQ